MENFVVSARKYRPVTFDSVVGQSSITSTLKSAILNNHLAQAFLFTGPRGVGKTTCARIFAKTINCEHLNDKMEPCDQCESCVSFNRNNSFNIHELDAASNNSVEDIRRLVEQVRIPPQLGKYKVYIIDEVHMLSQAAFNAFLKTLEEPPAYAKFILATTEKHKIIPTILSRCQIYDFNRITLNDIAEHIAYVAQNEGVTVEPKALMVMAQKADGAMRDALSIFDQIVSFAGNHVSYKATIENLNVLDEEYYFRLVNFVLQGDISNSLLLYNEVVSKGFDGLNFINGLASHLRNLLVSKDAGTITLIETSEQSKQAFAQQSVQCSLRFLIGAIDLCSQVDLAYKNASDKRLLVELNLMKMCKLTVPFESDSQAGAEKKNPELNPNPVTAAQVPSVSEPEALPLSRPVSPAVSVQNEATPPTSAVIEPKVEAEFKILKTNRSRGLSLSNELDQKAIISGDQSTEETLNQRFDSVSIRLDEKDIIQGIKDFLNHTRIEKPVYANSLLAEECKLGDNNTLNLVFTNQSAAENKETLTELIQFLRKELNTTEIQMGSIEIHETEVERQPTAMERYLKMTEINPQLDALRKQLDMDLRD